MVNISQKYNLNHINNYELEQTEIALAASTMVVDLPIELFSRKLAYSNDLKRIPILRGITGTWDIREGIAVAMNASGIAEGRFTLTLYNAKDATDSKTVIFSCHGYIGQGGGTISVLELEPIEDNLQGGVLLKPDIFARLYVGFNTGAVGSAFPAAKIATGILMEIDWISLTEKQKDDYIREFLFSEEE